MDKTQIEILRKNLGIQLDDKLQNLFNSYEKKFLEKERINFTGC